MRRIDTIYKPKHKDISIFDYKLKPKRIEYMKDGVKYAKIVYDDNSAGKSGTFAKRPDLAKQAAVLGGFNHALPKIDCKHDQWPQEPFEHEGVDYYRCSNCRMVKRRR